MPYRIGKYTLGFDQPPAVLSYAAVGSKKESEGPLKDAFDFIEQDSYFGEKSWERGLHTTPGWWKARWPFPSREARWAKT